ncbi:hypothetical protein [Lebetimonas sp. JH292]|uniref:hypothetical protein n=1 Tax=Lebetimonas sp. JH292 TaxID=990068 RepID=UPI0012EB505C|nr:hypothetical protein [Lebetimonas sp. JH292]
MFEKIINLFLSPAKSIEYLKINDNDNFVVISNTALGDTLLSTPAIKSLKKSFPNNKIIAVLIAVLSGSEYILFKKIFIKKNQHAIEDD